MARKLSLLALFALSFGLTGCVTSTDKYTSFRLENEALRQQLGEAESKARAAGAQADSYKNQLALLVDGSQSKEGLLVNQANQLALLTSENADLKRKYEEALANQGRVGPALPQAVTTALDSFAHDNPDLVDFDSARGIVKFKTDFTFATGSADLTDKAKQAISRFAGILNSDAAKGYELMVAGHTDNSPVVNPATKAKHPDNWYLSSHRAIAVGDEMLKHSVSPQRLAVVGYADQRPIASNASTEGKAQNRRVEVLILPSTVRVASVTTPKKATAVEPKKATNNLNKDSIASPDKGPVLNK